MLAILTAVFVAANLSRGQSLDFPPGKFVDSSPLHVSDFRGKVLVLCFYDPALPEDWSDPQVPRWLLTKGLIEPVEPVCFVCVACGMNVQQVRADQTETPPVRIYADTWRVMEHRAGGPRPKSRRWRYTVLGPDGDVIGTPGIDAATAAARIDRTLPKSHWTYRARHTPDRLKEAVEALEYGQFETGARLTRRAFSDHDPSTAQAAKDLHEHLRSDARTWNEQAAATEPTDPVSAYDAYAKISAIFPNDNLGRSALRSLRKLENTREVRSEIAARSAYAKLDALPDLGIKAIPDAIDSCRAIATKFPTAAAGMKSAQLADELVTLPAPPPAPPPTAFALHIENVYGAAGHIMLYQITPDSVAVGFVSDWAGQRPRELYRAALTPGQRDALQQFLSNFPLKDLKTSYADPAVNDGFQCSFTFRIARQPPKTVHVANRRVGEIEALRTHLNRLLPENLRIGSDSSVRAR